MKKIYTLANMAKGMMLAALLAVGTTALAQNVSGNTENGTVEGKIIGTNLACMMYLLGTEFLPNMESNILLNMLKKYQKKILLIIDKP